MQTYFDIESFIPPALAAHRTWIGICFNDFLARLPAERFASIVAAQQALPADASHEQRLIACLECCPTLHKLGQVLARDKRLDAALRAALQRLEVMTSHTNWATIAPIVQSELGDAIPACDIRPAQQSIGEGSVAIVWPITWRSPDADAPQRAVLKIPRPGVRERVCQELDIIADVADRIDAEGSPLGLPPGAWRETFDDVRRLLESEIDFRGEQAHLATAARQYAGDADVVIPALAPFCTAGVTVMSYIEGGKITDLEPMEADARRRIARRTASALISRTIFARDADALFHGDPHAGNLMQTTDDRLGIIDWSLAATLTDAQRRAIAKMMIGGISLDASALGRAIAELARCLPDEATIRDLAAKALADIGIGATPGLSWMLRTLDRSVMAGVRFPENSLLLRKSLHALQGVLEDVSPDATIDAWLFSDAMASMARDLPGRSLAMPGDTRFGVRLSNADLLQAWCSLPLMPLRLWQQALSRRP